MKSVEKTLIFSAGILAGLVAADLLTKGDVHRIVFDTVTQTVGKIKAE